jgi:hypothetical protein
MHLINHASKISDTLYHFMFTRASLYQEQLLKYPWDERHVMYTMRHTDACRDVALFCCVLRTRGQLCVMMHPLELDILGLKHLSWT